jgi:hypothetical protein
MAMTNEESLSIVIDVDEHADNGKKSDFDKQVAGSIEILEDRVYITADNICLGFDRYVLTELITREGKS